MTSPCLLVLAGGKRLVFGAPLHQDWRGIGQLDAAFLFEGRPESSGGVMGLRYETWTDGRTSPLLLISGELTMDMLSDLDAALLVPDALMQVDRPDRLDARQAGFRPKPVPADNAERLVFDTGDLKVFATSVINGSGDQIMTYMVVYMDRHVELMTCGSAPYEGRISETRIQPLIDQSAITVMLRDAIRDHLEARVAELTRAGKTCHSLTDAIATAHEGGVTELVFLLSGEDGPGLQGRVEGLNRQGLPDDGLSILP